LNEVAWKPTSSTFLISRGYEALVVQVEQLDVSLTVTDEIVGIGSRKARRLLPFQWG
jgi:hypothetical protein